MSKKLRYEPVWTDLEKSLKTVFICNMTNLVFDFDSLHFVILLPVSGMGAHIAWCGNRDCRYGVICFECIR